ncbi:5'/3'-nucleotidase SurE [Alicyclobacillus pomorum]|jgi:5'-nucleotidase|uniref:5'/3'-nucleotidase SurE n=1 Tax=Alicyclobacillus pomorum TaxID=204470 RepID=UPI0003F4C7E2|nr:5'/3'-nucleotidase SurE [Alicyclobacillus pomorum]
MRILISNDDGIHAPGIRALAEAVKDAGELVVVAPDRQRSASSHGISLYQRLYVNEVDFGMQGVQAYSVSGTPVDCVKWAIASLSDKRPFDLMLSGINEGPNLATDVLYSGTLAAAGEAALHQVRAIAFSLTGTPFLYEDAAQVSRRIIDVLNDIPFPADTFVSINFPNRDIVKAPWRVTQLGARSYRDLFTQKTDEQGNPYFRYTGEALVDAGGSDTDVYVVEHGGISLTPLKYHFTNDEMIATLKTKFEDNEKTRR